MTDEELKKEAKAEQKNITEILTEAGISKARIKALTSVIQNTAWIKVKLDDARGAIKTSSVAIPYDNGGGQKGIRENPLFKGYEALWKSYMLGMTKILDTLPPEEIETKTDNIDKPKTMLELVRNKHIKDA